MQQALQRRNQHQQSWCLETPLWIPATTTMWPPLSSATSRLMGGISSVRNPLEGFAMGKSLLTLQVYIYIC
ncbi:unnamed protein product [Linum tenue]|uniref:Uncharacterized protein n=1 Tax=Linum tenue TaxID=586396 RepID=A0AAV0I5K1_9ROSI|nr:unnamed protein product [Linum tenue]